MKITSLEIHPGGFFGGLIPPGGDPSPDPIPDPDPDPTPEPEFRSYLDDSSGNNNDLTPVTEGDIPNIVDGLVPGDEAIQVTDVMYPFALKTVLPTISDPDYFTVSWWACGWLDNVVDATCSLIAWNYVVGGGTGIFVGPDPDIPGNHLIGVGVDTTSDSIVNPDGPAFIFIKFDIDALEFTFYENGVLISTVAAPDFVGESVLAVYITLVFTGTITFDEIASGAGDVTDEQVANLYAQRLDFVDYKAAQLALNPVVYYHLGNDPDDFTSPDDPGPGFFIYE